MCDAQAMTDTGAFNEIGREAVRLRLAEYPREMRLTAQVWLLEQDAIVAAQRRKLRLRLLWGIIGSAFSLLAVFALGEIMHR